MALGCASADSTSGLALPKKGPDAITILLYKGVALPKKGPDALSVVVIYNNVQGVALPKKGPAAKRLGAKCTYTTMQINNKCDPPTTTTC